MISKKGEPSVNHSAFYLRGTRHATATLVEHRAVYFKDKDGQLPRSLDGFLGQEGHLAHTIRAWFDPAEGRSAS